MQITILKQLRAIGQLVDAQVVPFKDAWTLRFQTNSGTWTGVETQRGGVKVYRSIDAAVNDSIKIGFEAILVKPKETLSEVNYG